MQTLGWPRRQVPVQLLSQRLLVLPLGRALVRVLQPLVWLAPPQQVLPPAQCALPRRVRTQQLAQPLPLPPVQVLQRAG